MAFGEEHNHSASPSGVAAVPVVGNEIGQNLLEALGVPEEDSPFGSDRSREVHVVDVVGMA